MLTKNKKNKKLKLWQISRALVFTRFINFNWNKTEERQILGRRKKLKVLKYKKKLIVTKLKKKINRTKKMTILREKNQAKLWQNSTTQTLTKTQVLKNSTNIILKGVQKFKGPGI